MNNALRSRVFVISEYVDSSQNSTGYYWSKIINGLSLTLDVVVICPERDVNSLNVLHRSNVRFLYTKKINHNKNNLFSRLYGQVLQSMLFLIAIIKNVSVNDVIFSGTNPAPSLLFICLLKPVKRFKWLLLVHDVFPENLLAAKVVKGNNIAYDIVKFFFDRVYRVPDILIAIGRDMKGLLISKTSSNVRVEYIPNWADANEIVPEQNPLVDASESKKIIFQFFGNIGKLQGIDNILEAIKLVKTKKVRFEFIGNGSEAGLIVNFIKNNPDVPVFYSPGVAFGAGNALLSKCDVAIVSLTTGMNGLGVPSKAYFSLAADKPLLVITDQDSELHQLVNEEDSVGWYCEAGSPYKLAALIDDICNNHPLANQGMQRAVMLKKYDYTNAICRYSELIEQLLK